ncbi:GTP cyclohydrolase II [Spiribacter vilamensis]|uniref:GTP cyclohydrolase-2 n=1 Tax=Spiribacter vilamensis TaxID=531306 RepID=A0A4Q8D2T0_9GAMM|nr:GTP cyclohydrolase II [Spiribacter vilamensis]RZU99652.1 GTP cyclohydrolase II [Spiribacter vilamensis]TVO61392.1 GTP cyclohydrolase II [Spiribacter vilamensis]
MTDSPLDNPSIARETGQARLPTRWGTFRIHGFEADNGGEHVALVMGDPAAADAPLVRVHSECLTGDALFSQRCDCGPQLEAAMKRIGETGEGIIVYLRQEGRGIGLLNKIRAYGLQDEEGADTVEANEALGFAADGRDYGVAASMLGSLGVSRVRLMTNNPAKVDGLEATGVRVVERLSLLAGRNHHNHAYLETKAAKFGHHLDAPDGGTDEA